MAEQVEVQLLELKVKADEALAELTNISKVLANVAAAAEKTAGSTEKVNEELKKTGGVVQGLAQGLGQKMFEQFSNFVTGLPGKIKATVTETASWADHLSKLSNRTGISTKALQEWSVAAKTTGFSLDMLSRYNVMLSNTMMGHPEKFRKLGIEFNEFAKMKPEERFQRLAQSISKLSGPEASKALTSLFGKQGAGNVGPFLRDMEEGAKRARELGLVMGKEDVDAAAKLDTQIGILGQTFEALRHEVGAIVATDDDFRAGVEKSQDAMGFLIKTVKSLHQAYDFFGNSTAGRVTKAIVGITGAIIALSAALAAGQIAWAKWGATAVASLAGAGKAGALAAGGGAALGVAAVGLAGGYAIGRGIAKATGSDEMLVDQAGNAQAERGRYTAGMIAQGVDLRMGKNETQAEWQKRVQAQREATFAKFGISEKDRGGKEGGEALVREQQAIELEKQRLQHRKAILEYTLQGASAEEKARAQYAIGVQLAEKEYELKKNQLDMQKAMDPAADLSREYAMAQEAMKQQKELLALQKQAADRSAQMQAYERMLGYAKETYALEKAIQDVTDSRLVGMEKIADDYGDAVEAAKIQHDQASALLDKKLALKQIDEKTYADEKSMNDYRLQKAEELAALKQRIASEDLKQQKATENLQFNRELAEITRVRGTEAQEAVRAVEQEVKLKIDLLELEKANLNTSEERRKEIDKIIERTRQLGSAQAGKTEKEQRTTLLGPGTEEIERQKARLEEITSAAMRFGNEFPQAWQRVGQAMAQTISMGIKPTQEQVQQLAEKAKGFSQKEAAELLNALKGIDPQKLKGIPGLKDLMGDLEKRTFTARDAVASLSQAFSMAGEALRLMGQEGSALGKIAGLAGGITGQLGGMIDRFGDGTGSLKGGVSGLFGAKGLKGNMSQKLAAGGAIGGMLSTVGGMFGPDSTAGRALGGAAMGAQLGSVAGPWGMAAGAVVGAIVGAFKKPSWMKVGEEAGKALGMKVSKELAQAIEKTAKDLGVSTKTAALLNLDKAIAESKKSVKEFAGQIKDLMNVAKEGGKGAAEAIGTLGKVFGMAQEEARKLGSEFNQTTVKMIQDARKAGLKIPEMQAAVEAGLSKAREGVGKLVATMIGEDGKIRKVAEDQAKANAYVFASVFWADVREKGMTEAVAYYGDMFNTLLEQMKASGVTEEFINTVLGPIGAIIGTITDERLKPMYQQLDAIKQAVGGLAEAGYMTKGAFDALGTTIKNTYEETTKTLMDQGMERADAEKQALQAMLPYLAEQKRLAETYGITLDENTKKLIEQAEAQGVAFPVDPMLQILDVLEAIADALGAVRDGAREAGDAIGGMPGPRNTRGGSPDDFPPSDRPVDVSSAGGLGPVKLKEDTVIQAHKDEHVLIVPKGRKVKFRAAARGYGEVDREEREGGGVYGGTDPSTSGSNAPQSTAPTSTAPTQTEQQTLEEISGLKESLAELAKAVAEAQPSVTVNYTVAPAINENPLKNAQDREQQRRFTVDTMAAELRSREGEVYRLIQEAANG